MDTRGLLAVAGVFIFLKGKSAFRGLRHPEMKFPSKDKKEGLNPLKREYVIDKINPRGVQKDCLISFGGNQYSASSGYAGKDVAAAAGQPVPPLAVKESKLPCRLKERKSTMKTKAAILSTSELFMQKTAKIGGFQAMWSECGDSKPRASCLPKQRATKLRNTPIFNLLLFIVAKAARLQPGRQAAARVQRRGVRRSNGIVQ